jgi:hypothetical protein
MNKNFKCDDEDDHRSSLLVFFFFLCLMLIGMFLSFLNTIIMEYQWTRQIFIDICFSNRQNESWSNSTLRRWWRWRRLFACSSDNHPLISSTRLSLSLCLLCARFLSHIKVLVRRASEMMDMFNEQRSSTKDDELWHAQVITIIVIISFFSRHKTKKECKYMRVVKHFDRWRRKEILIDNV